MTDSGLLILKRGDATFNDLDTDVVAVTAATLTVVKDTHNNKILKLDRAAGIAVTLPASDGGGQRYEFVVSTDITTAGSIKASAAADVFAGAAIIGEDGAAPLTFHTTAGTDTIAMDGGGAGGFQGDRVVLTDIEANLWHVEMIATANTTASTPFDATVS